MLPPVVTAPFPPKKKGHQIRAPGCFVCACGLESVAQRELDQPRRPHGGCDLAEVAPFDVGERRVSEVGVVPDVEKVCREPQTLTFGKFEVFDQREIPVLLPRPAERVASKVSEAGCAEVGIGQALRRIQLRSKIESAAIQVAIDSRADAPAGESARQRGS